MLEEQFAGVDIPAHEPAHEPVHVLLGDIAAVPELPPGDLDRFVHSTAPCSASCDASGARVAASAESGAPVNIPTKLGFGSSRVPVTR